MANVNKESRERQIWSAQRRRVFGWLGKVVLGVSVAGMGLEALSPQDARAATAYMSKANATLLHTHHAAQAVTDGALQPDCIPCPTNCEVVDCSPNSEYCGVNAPYVTILWYYQGGCVAPGHVCPTIQKAVCGTGCQSC